MLFFLLSLNETRHMVAETWIRQDFVQINTLFNPEIINLNFELKYFIKNAKFMLQSGWS